MLDSAADMFILLFKLFFKYVPVVSALTPLHQEKDMAEVELDIKQWGNNLGVRLPASIARESNLKAHQRVRISVHNGEIVIKPIVQPQLTLEQRLALYQPDLHGGEAMQTTQAIGAEAW